MNCLGPGHSRGVERPQEQRRSIGCAGGIATTLVWLNYRSGLPVARPACRSSRSDPATPDLVQVKLQIGPLKGTLWR
jgi:hypothetical protein